MKKEKMPTLIAHFCHSWSRQRSLILGSSLLVLAAVLTWQVSARLTAAAKSNSPATSTIEAATTETVITAVPGGGGCNNCCGSWSQKTNAAPAARDIHAMAYAQQCNRVVMFGGRLASGGVAPANVTDQTWEWDGNTMTWAQFTPATRPAARGQHAMAYDAARKQVVLFGGLNSSFGGLNDTWVYDCVTHTWTQKFPANSPSARHRHAMAYDPNSQLVVLYGGGSSFQDTWTWDGTNWVEIVGANQPGIRNEHAMAFDGTRVILFGGSKNAGFADNDTWDLTLTSPSAGTWTMVAANGTGPNKRQRHAMAYAPNCQKVTLFGGSTDVTNYTNDTWEWSRSSLSWCQTSVASPPSPGREYPAMAHDGRGVLMYGGLNSSLAQLGDAWRFACSGPYTKRAGKADTFNLPTDPTWATTAFKANVDGVYSTPPKMDFDEPTTNKFFLQSFSGLPTNIVRAELEVRAQPNGGASNDSIHLDFPPFNAPAFTWSKNFFALHPGGTWDPGQGANTFILDLCNLPAGGVGQPTNLIGLLNANQSLHVMIQDDTSVDYIKLRLWSCPPKKHFAGLAVEPLGQAQLSEDASSNLVIGNIGASGNDGATFELGETSGASIKLTDTLSSLPNGSYVEARGTGRIGGAPNSSVDSMRLTRVNDRVTLAPNYTGLGASTFHLALYNDGNTVFSQGGLSGNAVSAPAANVAPTLQFGGQGNIIILEDIGCIQIIITEDVLLRVSGLDIGAGDTLVFTPESPTQPVELFSQIQFVGAGVSTARVTGVGLNFLPDAPPYGGHTPSFQVLGGVQLEPFTGGLTVTNIGSSGQDGVSISNARAIMGNVTVTLEDIDPMGIAPVDASVQFSTSLILAVQPPPPPRKDYLSITNTKPIIPPIFPEDTFRVTGNFSELGATSLHVTAFNGATQVAEMINFTGEVLVSDWPNVVARTGNPGTVGLGYQLDFPAGTQVKFGPCPPAPCDQGFTITHLRILPQSTNVTVSHLSEMRMYPLLDDPFTITGVTVTPVCNQTISVSPAGSLTTARVNQAYSQQLAANGGFAPYTFAVTAGTLNTGLSLDRVTGRITGTPTSTTPSTFTITTTDDNGCTGSQAYTLTPIVCPTITVNPATAFGGFVGTAYNLTFTASGGTGPYTFARVTGTLPPGLILAPTGALTGTPTSAGAFNFTVEATDSSGCTGTKAYTLTIICPTITVGPASLIAGTVGTAFSQTFTATGGTGPYTFARVTGTLPPGLTLNGATGLLSGTPTTAGTYTFTVEATASNGCTGTRDYTVAISGSGLMFYPMPNPVRIVDTRPGQAACSQPGNPIAGGTSLTQAAAGFCGIPSVARAILGNVTVVTPAANGFLTIFPSNATQPTAANTNFITDDVLNNVFTVGLGPADGAFKIFASATVHIVVDVTGYFAPPQPAPASGLFLHMLPTPIRLEDTRPGLPACVAPGTPLPGGVDTTHQGATTCSGVTIPSTARAILGNVTVVTPAANGFLTLFPADTTRPLASSGNYRAGAVLNSPFTVGLSPTGQFKIFTAATTDVVIDVIGYFSPDLVDVNGTGLLFTPLTPTRLVDSRPGQPACFNLGAPLASGVDTLQAAANTCTIASTARAVLGNVTVVIPPANGFLTFWPSDTPRPLISTSNYLAGRNFNRFFTTALGAANGGFKMFSSQTINLVVDVSGYFAP